MTTSTSRRARPAILAAVLVAFVGLAMNPLGPRVTSALAADPPSPETSPAALDPPTPVVALDPTPGPTASDPLATDSPTSIPSAPDPTPATTPTPDPTPSEAPSPNPAPDPQPTATADPTPTASLGPATIGLTIEPTTPAAAAGRIQPDAALSLVLSATPAETVPTATMTLDLPVGWALIDSGGGTIDGSSIRWTLGALDAGTPVSRTAVLRAPSLPDASGSYVVASTFDATIDQGIGLPATASFTITVAPQLVMDAVTFARVDDTGGAPTYLAPAEPITGLGRFESVRVRFRLWNAGTSSLEIVPTLEAAGPTVEFSLVPATRTAGAPLIEVTEWRRVSGGTRPGPLLESIPIEDLLGPPTVEGETSTAVAGIRLMGGGPAPRVTLTAGAWTDVEFTVRTTAGAAYGETYHLRLTDGGTAVPLSATGALSLGPAPRLQLSPGQLVGIPADSTSTTTSPPSYPLAMAAVLGATSGPFVSPHGNYSALTSACAACHRGHSGDAPYLLTGAATTAAVCLSCHGGSGATSNVGAAYSDPSVPANDAEASAYYRHDALSATIHTSATANEWQSPAGTPILDRHSACSDCHDAHRASAAPAVSTPIGWTAPGALTGISGVAVSNGSAGAAPTYTSWTSPDTSHATVLEYELCFKCHSGFTEPPARDAGAPSTWALDKGIELNPANASVHPVEAAGTNRTAAMAASLTGSSPFKQWRFLVTDAVRCQNCHGDPSRFSASNPPAAGSDLAPHVSQYRGILFQRYTDRALKSASADYDPTDFALCYVCHSEAPFKDASGSARPDTNFQYHGLHVTGLKGLGSGGTSIDTAADGQGNAICAECHFRVHSTALAYRPDDRSNQRLVTFAPNVIVPTGGGWSSTGIAAGTCTLTCHQQGHSDAYGPIAQPLILAVVVTPPTFSAAGETIDFQYIVTNATNATISGPVAISDPAVGTVLCPSGDVGVGQTVTCSASYITAAADVSAGSVTSTAMATAGALVSNGVTTSIALSP